MLARELNRLIEAEPRLLELDEQSESSQDKWLFHPQRAESFRHQCFPAEDDNSVFALRYLSLILRRLLKPRTPRD